MHILAASIADVSKKPEVGSDRPLEGKPLEVKPLEETVKPFIEPRPWEVFPYPNIKSWYTCALCHQEVFGNYHDCPTRRWHPEWDRSTVID